MIIVCYQLNIYDNNIYENNGYGISLSPGYNINYVGTIKVYRNRIFNNTDSGITLGSADTSRHARIYNNLILNNPFAINILPSSSYNQIYSNSIGATITGHGVNVQAGSSNNEIKNNAIKLTFKYQSRT